MNFPCWFWLIRNPQDHLNLTSTYSASTHPYLVCQCRNCRICSLCSVLFVGCLFVLYPTRVRLKCHDLCRQVKEQKCRIVLIFRYILFSRLPRPVSYLIVFTLSCHRSKSRHSCQACRIITQISPKLTTTITEYKWSITYSLLFEHGQKFSVIVASIVPHKVYFRLQNKRFKTHYTHKLLPFA